MTVHNITEPVHANAAAAVVACCINRDNKSDTAYYK